MNKSDKIKITLDGSAILVTGVAGFIGSCVAMRLLLENSGSLIIGVDNINDYYSVELKEYRLQKINEAAKESKCRWLFIRGSIADRDFLDEIFSKYRINIVVNLAAQAGVRYSIENPDTYIESNMTGFYNILEECRRDETLKHLVYASSSSVYGNNNKVPFSVSDQVDNPVSLYAATKKSNELLAHAYSKLYDIPSTGLRFFTVYGPAGRPDMAYFSFTEKLRRGDSIKVYNYGRCSRDFTYIDDIVEGVIRVIQGAPAEEKGMDGLPVAPYAIYNIGGGHPQDLMEFIKILSEELIDAGVLASGFDLASRIELVPMQPGDVPVTFADVTDLEMDYGYKPETDLRSGLRQFAKWYRDYYKL